MNNETTVADIKNSSFMSRNKQDITYGLDFLGFMPNKEYTPNMNKTYKLLYSINAIIGGVEGAVDALTNTPFNMAKYDSPSKALIASGIVSGVQGIAGFTGSIIDGKETFGHDFEPLLEVAMGVKKTCGTLGLSHIVNRTAYAIGYGSVVAARDFKEIIHQYL